ncbi:aspartyl protease family protein [uncultured Sphingomonas sp.]|uniref:aspartyl protease family protein n=1 Tax=uncultured Sphingomonas sp. TaxID=158754 RepID=UPI0025E4183A|nr:aspartyl protease family protein [uncultured Sphingomonas sp.]
MIDRRTMLGAVVAAPLFPYAARGEGRRLVNSIAVEDNRVWIAAQIGTDPKPRYFVIDTGANVSLINDALAKRLGMKVIGQSDLLGVGGVSRFPYYNGSELTFASGLRVPNMLFAGTDARLGNDAAGALSAGLFTSYDSDLDFVKGEWRAYPEGRPDFAGLSQLKSRFIGDRMRGVRILADATLGGRTGEYLMDTGVPGQVVIEGRAATRSGLWSADRPYAPAQGSGIGRARVKRRIVRGDTLTIGSVRFDRPLVAVSAPGTPGHEGDGFIGLGILERLHLTTQIKPGTLWIAANDRPAPAERYAFSGLWFDREGDDIVVGDVGTGSPAAAAGIKVGDRVSSIIWEELLRRNAQPAGSDMALRVVSGGKGRDVTLKLAPYL